MANITLDKVTKRFGNVTAVKELSVEIQHGEFFCVLGPPGAGKTTTLRLIVGLETPDSGQVIIDGEVANEIHPGKRDIAMMFQNLALYPDKTVFDNMAYPLRERKMPKAQIEARVTAVAKKLYIDHLLQRKPAKLSGGERQRVALGRSLVREPRAYLMDEPLANLDALLRLEMRVELKRLQQELKQTLVYVTHDQVEAMSMSDRIAVLNKGVLQQCDTPDAIYHLPANQFVATVVGSPPTNFVPVDVGCVGDDLRATHPAFSLRAGGNHPLLPALAAGQSLPAHAVVGVRPEDVVVLTEPSGPDAMPAKVVVIEPLGGETVVDLHLGPTTVKAVVPPSQKLAEGQPVWLRFDSNSIHFFDQATGARRYSTSEGAKVECAGEARH